MSVSYNMKNLISSLEIRIDEQVDFTEFIINDFIVELDNSEQFLPIEFVETIEQPESQSKPPKLKSIEYDSMSEISDLELPPIVEA
jgi:hypothetical protein